VFPLADNDFTFVLNLNSTKHSVMIEPGAPKLSKQPFYPGDILLLAVAVFRKTPPGLNRSTNHGQWGPCPGGWEKKRKEEEEKS